MKDIEEKIIQYKNSAITELEQFFELILEAIDTKSEKYNTFLLFKSRLNRISRENNLGVLGYEDSRVIKNRIVSNILNELDNLSINDFSKNEELPNEEIDYKQLYYDTEKAYKEIREDFKNHMDINLKYTFGLNGSILFDIGGNGFETVLLIQDKFMYLERYVKIAFPSLTKSYQKKLFKNKKLKLIPEKVRVFGSSSKDFSKSNYRELLPRLDFEKRILFCQEVHDYRLSVDDRIIEIDDEIEVLEDRNESNESKNDTIEDIYQFFKPVMEIIDLKLKLAFYKMDAFIRFETMCKEKLK